MSNDIYREGSLAERWDDSTRTVTTYGATGQVTNTRPYTTAENTAADDAAAAYAAAAAARARAELADAILDATAALMQDAHEDGQPWVQPSRAHNAYPLGMKVTHAGKTWENLTPANVWTPGVSGWREVVTGGGIPAWVQPTGAHDAYPLGAQVTHAGRKWTSTVAANVWPPGTGALWTDDGPV